MSGHSHFKTIKATKDANDAKKGKNFSKLGRIITLAAREGGRDVATNPALKSAIERARQFNMPKENIDRAIKKGTGELISEMLEEVSFEGFGPGGTALIINGITDNKNRTLGEIKNILGQYGGKIANQGAVRWMFEKKGIINLPVEQESLNQISMTIIEAGADDFKNNGDFIEIYAKPEKIGEIKKNLEEKRLKIESVGIGWVPREEVSISEKDKKIIQRLFEELSENDAVSDIYSNFK